MRSGIRLILESEDDIEVVGEASNGKDAIKLTRKILPDLIMMDISMPELGGVEATKAIRTEFPDLPILVLTMHEDERYFFQLLKAGANGYLVKGAAPGDLLAAIRAVAKGGAYLYPSLAKYLVEDYRNQSSGQKISPEDTPLSKRELEVLRLTAQGLTARQVGERLSISSNTVERHRANIMNKLNLSNRAQLVRYAVERNLLPNS